METVLITGGSGMIGQHLIPVLEKEGFKVIILRRKTSSSGKSFTWDLEKGIIEKGAITTADYIVNLAGAGLAEQRWTKARKQELYESRVASTALLFHYARNHGTIKAVISASAVGYYGNRGDEWLSEESKAGNDFLARLCVDWEKQSLRFQEIGIRTVVNRFGVVFSKDGGALKKLAQPVDFGINPYMGSGKQFMSWIHIDDLCSLILYEIRNTAMQGIYNAVAPNPVSNKELMQTIVKAKRKSALSVPIPEIALEISLGEMSQTILGSQRCSCERLIKSGYRFQYSDVDSAMSKIYG